MLDAIVGVISSILAGIIAWTIKVNNRLTALETYKKAQEEKEEIVNDLLNEKLTAVLHVTQNLDKNVSLKFEHMQQLMEERGDHWTSSLAEISRRIDRIERSMNGHLQKT
jgi:hypothetical protein